MRAESGTYIEEEFFETRDGGFRLYGGIRAGHVFEGFENRCPRGHDEVTGDRCIPVTALLKTGQYKYEISV